MLKSRRPIPVIFVSISLAEIGNADRHRILKQIPWLPSNKQITFCLYGRRSSWAVRGKLPRHSMRNHQPPRPRLNRHGSRYCRPPTALCFWFKKWNKPWTLQFMSLARVRLSSMKIGRFGNDHLTYPPNPRETRISKNRNEFILAESIVRNIKVWTHRLVELLHGVTTSILAL
jgi:hypothetical protein